MADRTGDLREKSKVCGGFVSPRGDLSTSWYIVECGIQLNRIKLRRVICQLIFGAAGVKPFQVLSVPFRAAYIDRWRLVDVHWLIAQHVERARIRGWKCEVNR